MIQLHRGLSDRLEIYRISAGVGLVRGGAGTALVGGPSAVVERLEEFAELASIPSSCPATLSREAIGRPSWCFAVKLDHPFADRGGAPRPNLARRVRRQRFPAQRAAARSKAKTNRQEDLTCPHVRRSPLPCCGKRRFQRDALTPGFVAEIKASIWQSRRTTA